MYTNIDLINVNNNNKKNFKLLKLYILKNNVAFLIDHVNSNF